MFEDESVGLMAEHRAAMNCYDCEAFLQLGIDAHRWLVRFNSDLRKVDDRIDLGEAKPAELLMALSRQWMTSCEFALNWIKQVEIIGFDVQNKREFENAIATVRVILRKLEEEYNTAVQEESEWRQFANGSLSKSADFSEDW